MVSAQEQELLDSYPQKCQEGSLPGTPGNLEPEQKTALEEFRKALEDAGFDERLDDATLLRFLRARKFDIALAKEMFENCEKWRKEYGTNTILTDFHYDEKPLVAKFYPQYYHKTDKDGRPCYFEELGAVNLPEMIKITTEERMLKNLVWEYESVAKYRVPACSRAAGYLVETSCTIMDLKGISISSAYSVLNYVREASYISQNFYPERMGKFYMINAPFGFSTAFRLFKPFLDPVTVSKIFILSSSYQKELLKQIPAENLPTKFGGKSEVDEATGGLYLSDIGPWRDQKYIGPEGEAPEVFSMK
ncbi:similar to Saccharomyces cerevisiae YMR079W SEC14 Phosphatidylinositol/phosphatidylcholine transfer protein [Maudiozyma barnettii]|uniref:Similar to Saccharomyces cerevisiae YMR079W SEC14 Phosphatidylinositol/phosphatidylcholine transfer protein n=1 Tax=Maudiozyma barnettii TaxID=61262 RepID=A0A8H2ZM98_9SACH|nr:phosphatidylinositol/phosphatidylcholine transfer protein SEC14 [Kazachstania barnettii]CAB4256882.1 similar to Saccharomyces cerevisiae YMR079W SEC14 Phosphatidylinositol/phosphatidylcholine transfer protein [Kazachstania barnettii]CAD1785301.1 similar to Saccharomyces cerevisiae YMR079W SEC14 Phosphatidylinositol/phosphatidylcholine transfer protein [Kazachstania barnettii]